MCNYGYEIIDNDGVIYSDSDEEEINRIWDQILNDEIDLDWNGNLKLVKVLRITR